MWGSPYLAAQAAYLEHLGTARGAEVMESDGVYAVRTRVPSNAENGVLSCARAQVTRAIAEKLAGWFGEWNVPASWLCAEGIGRAGVAATLEAAGYRPERSSWEMRGAVHSVDLGGSAGHPALRIEPVSSERALGGWLDVAAECGWFESAHARHALKGVYVDLGLAATAPLRHYVALRGEVALGMASAFFTGDVVLLAAVAVRPSARREGIGRALALVRLREARERHCSLAVLAPSPHGAEMYEAMAFESHLSPPDRWFYAPLHRPGGNATQGPSQ